MSHILHEWKYNSQQAGREAAVYAVLRRQYMNAFFDLSFTDSY